MGRRNRVPIEDENPEQRPDSAVARSLERSRQREYENFSNYGETLIFAYDSAVLPELSDAELSAAEAALSQVLGDVLVMPPDPPDSH